MPPLLAAERRAFNTALLALGEPTKESRASCARSSTLLPEAAPRASKRLTITSGIWTFSFTDDASPNQHHRTTPMCNRRLVEVPTSLPAEDRGIVAGVYDRIVFRSNDPLSIRVSPPNVRSCGNVL